MRRSGLSIFYVIMSLFLVMIIGFMLMNFMNMKTEQVCDYDNQGQCCISIVDPCVSNTSAECLVGACNTEDCMNKCGNETYCTLFPPNETIPNPPHACVSEKCVGDISECSPVECTMAAFKYDPKTKSGPNNREWWLVLDTGNDNQCCQVNNDSSGALTKTCADEIQDP